MTIYPKLIHDALSTVRYPGNGKSIMENEMLEDDLRRRRPTLSRNP